MSRPVDCFDNVDIGCMPFSPKNVVLSGWVGDDDSTFQGLRSCMRKVIYSAHQHYTNFGCDINGYRGNDGTNDKELFIRWSQLGAFLPLMENGGGGEHRPWMYDEETVTIYRKFVLEHYRLIPYLLTIGNQAKEQGISSIIPISPPDELRPLHNPEPKTFSYLLGNNILIHPVMTNFLESNIININKIDNDKLSQVEMTFPGDENTEWLDYFKPFLYNKKEIGGTKKHRLVLISDYPVYVKRGSLIPLALKLQSLNNKDDYSKSPILFTWYAPKPSNEIITSEVREYEGNGLIGTVSLNIDGILSATITSHETLNGGFEIYGITEPQNIQIEQSKFSIPCSHIYFNAENKLSIRCLSLKGGIKITANDVKNVF